MTAFLFSNNYPHLNGQRIPKFREVTKADTKPNVTDRWEMKSTDIVFGKMIGDGAFGKVYKAEIGESKMSSIYKSKYTADAKKKKRKREAVKAAVKVLKGRDFLPKFADISNYRETSL